MQLILDTLCGLWNCRSATYSPFNSKLYRRTMGVSARLRWHPPLEIDVSVRGQLKLKDGLKTVPTTRGIYVIARKRRGGIIPIYVGLASRSLRQRLKQHLKSERMITQLIDGRRSKRLFFYAEVTPGDLEYAKRYLATIERALIRSAIRKGGALLNRHQRSVRAPATPYKFTFSNIGHREAWADWARQRITTELKPPRRRRITSG